VEDVMKRYACAFLTGATIVVGTYGAAIGGEPRNALSEAEAFSATAGTVLGAASVCDGIISKDRLAAATERVALVLQTTVSSEDELAVTRQLLTESIGVGKDAVRTGQTNCPRTEASLTQLEQIGGGDEEEERQER
jgi:hypothetical protein